MLFCCHLILTEVITAFDTAPKVRPKGEIFLTYFSVNKPSAKEMS